MLSLFALNPVAWLTDPFAQSLTMQRALFAGLLAGVACGLVGTWVVLRGMTFLGDAMAHGVVPGLALATIFGINPALGAALSAVVMIGGITLVERRTKLGEDTAIGLLFVGMLALGVLIVSRSQTFSGDLTGFLFGGITSVTPSDLFVAGGVAGGVTLVVIIGYRAFLALCFNAESARMFGLRPGLAHFVMLMLVTATIIASFKTVGTLLVFALITAPAAASVQLVRRVPLVLVTSVLLAEVSVVVGLIISWHARVAAGASIALSAVGLFLIVLAGTEVSGALRARRSNPGGHVDTESAEAELA
ncbi:MAG TPA: zinc ABC transporter permease AztB [Microthrixaceae bacterium]|nr:zinc ABC transporter permease AztB [Microthrixaceae bacterium]